MNFKFQVVEKELTEEKKRGRIDISAIDSKLKSEYEARYKKNDVYFYLWFIFDPKSLLSTEKSLIGCNDKRQIVA